MPTFTRSVLNPNGTYQPDAMDQVEQWNAQRGDQWAKYNMDRQSQSAQDDWRKEVALKQLGLTREMGMWGREDANAARQLEADRYGKQFGYMSERDKLMDARAAAESEAAQKRWAEQFGLQKTGIEEDRAYRNEERARQRPMQDIEAQLAQMRLQREKAQEAARTGAAGASAYTPSDDTGREAYQRTLAVTGDALQAGMAAKRAEQDAARASAEAAKSQLEANLQDFSATDKAMFGGDVTAQDQSSIISKVEAYAALLRKAGFKEPEINASVQQLLRQTLTSGGRTDWNAGPSEALIQRFGGTYR